MIPDIFKSKTIEEIKKNIENLPTNEIIQQALQSNVSYILKDILKKPNQFVAAGIQAGNTEPIKIGIKKGATNININNCEALIIAVEKNDFELFKALLKNQDIDSRNGGKRDQAYGDFDNGALRLSARDGKYEFVKLLLKDKRTDATTGKNYPLRNAFNNKHWDVVELLLTSEKVFYYDITYIKKILNKLIEYIK
jgi:hypothetical protein